MRRPLLIPAAALALSSLLLASACGSRSYSVRVTSIGAGGFENTGHTCVVTNAGKVWCWGANWAGQLGDGTTTSSPTPMPVPSLQKVKAISVGGDATCALLSNGEVKCWGENTRAVVTGSAASGQAISWPPNPKPFLIKGIERATSVSVWDGTGCAIVSGGVIRCWATDDSSDMLGRRGLTWSKTGGIIGPVTIKGIQNAVQVSVGYSHACAVLRTGSVKCWGENDYGEIGDGKMWNGNPDNVLTDLSPVFVKGIGNARAVAVGFGDSCALLSDGSIRCWGDNSMGQLGASNAEMWAALEKMLPRHVSRAAILRAFRNARLHPTSVKGIDLAIVRAARTTALSSHRRQWDPLGHRHQHG